MTVIDKCVYDEHGQLVPPTPEEVQQAQLRLENMMDLPGRPKGDAPTLDKGYCHVQVVRVGGWTRQQTKAEGDKRLSKLLDRIEWERGYREIATNHYKRRDKNGYLFLDIEIVYALEPEPQYRKPAPTKPESPHEGRRPHMTDRANGRPKGQYRVRGGQYRIKGAELANPIWFE